MIYTIEFTKHAIETSNAIKTQLYNRWGDKILEDFEERVINVLQLIEDMPLMFPVASFDKNLRKAFIHKNCAVFYEVKLNKVIVHFFWDNRQDPIF